MASAAKNTSPWLDSVPDRARYPKLEGRLETDVVVVGGGISGVMAAWHLAQNGLKVVLLEKNRIASGDTAFTTGFLLRVPDTSISKLEARYGIPFVKRLMEGAASAQDSIRKLVRERRIECGFSDCDAYYCSYSKGDEVLAEEWEALSKVDPRASFEKGKKLSGLGPDMKEAIVFKGEAQFNPRAFIFGLLALPEAKGIRIFEDSEVVDVEVGEAVLAKTEEGSVSAKKVVIASGRPIDAFSELRAVFEPKITYAIAAEYGKAPMTRDLFWDTYDPYFYYRMLDDKTVILGGADRKPGERPKPGEPEPHERLEAFLREHLGSGFSVTNAWSGTLYESPDGLPFASEHPHHKGKVFIGACCGFGGNGLLLGTFAGSVVADLVAGKKNPYADLLSFSRAGIEIPLPAPKVKRPEGPRTRIFVRVAGKDDVSEGSPLCAEAGGRKIALFRTKDGYFAIDNTCSHAGGSLCDGAQEGESVTCPLHGAKFDLRSGRVLGPPATKPLQSYKTRLSGDSVEVEVEAEARIPAPPAGQPAASKAVASAPRAPAGPKLFAGAMANAGYVLKASILALLFWALQFMFQYYVSIPGQMERSIILASSFTGATLIGIALMLGPVAVLFPRKNFVAHRRAFGVWGFTFILTHATVATLFYQFVPESFLAELNPYKNPLVFGALAAMLYIPIYLTSTDWAVAKLGIRNWKAVHRLVYLAYLFSTLHYVTINPDLFWNLSKALLMAVTAAAYALELAAYAKYVGKRRTALNMLYGGALIAFGIILLYLAFQG